MIMPRRLLPLVLILTAVARADGPDDNLPDNVRRIPPPGISVPDDVRRGLTAGLEEFDGAIETIRASYGRNHPVFELLPDVLIYRKAVDWALRYNELYDAREFGIARKLLQQGTERARQLKNGERPWTTATG